MKKILTIFCLVAVACTAQSVDAAVAIKKASPVASTAPGGSEATASLVPNVIGLVANIIDMNAKQKALSEECIPSNAEITFVENMMKEWAKTGQTSAAALQQHLGRLPCDSSDCFATEVLTTQGAAGTTLRYNSFKGPTDAGMIWYGFPKPGIGYYCKDGSFNACSGKNKVTLSDAYDLFNLVDFGPADYLPTEATMAAKLLNKVESCSSARLNAKKKALWGEFLTTTVGSVGQKTNTGTIMQQVGAITSGGTGGAVGALGSVAAQFMNK